jgi:kynurenine formamidase
VALPASAPFGFTKVVFLSHVLAAAAPAFPGDPPTEINPVATIEPDGFYLQSLWLGEQSGTHWAAPAHFTAGQPAADELDPADFFRPAVVLDLRAEAAQDPDYALDVARIGQWEAAFGAIPPASAVLMWTGFDAKWDDPAAYLSQDAGGGLHYPGFSAEAARWLVEHRSAGALGIDTLGIDPGRDTSYGANHALLSGHRMHLENLCGLGQMPATGGWIVVGGLRVRAGSGSPATVFGLVP